MKRLAPLAVLPVLVVAAPLALAQADKPAADYKKAQTLLDTTTTVIGEPIAYPAGPAHVQSVLVTMEPGERTGWHKHGVPIFVHVLSGRVTVDYGDKGKRHYKAGDTFMEAMDQWHDGINESTKPARILVVFMGGPGTKAVIHKPK